MMLGQNHAFCWPFTLAADHTCLTQHGDSICHRRQSPKGDITDTSCRTGQSSNLQFAFVDDVQFGKQLTGKHPDIRRASHEMRLVQLTKHQWV